MKNIDYSVCDDLKVETLPTGRTYFTPNGNYPSVTTVLDKTADKRWMERWKQSLINKLGSEEAALEEMQFISKTATDRGEKVHSYLERYWNKEDIFPELINDNNYYDIQGMTNRLIKATQDNVTKVYAQEIALWNDELGYAGRVDMVGQWRGEDCIIDFKTSNKRKYLKGIKDYYLQVAGYAEAHNKMFNTNIEKLVILITVEDKNVQAFYGQRVHYLPELKFRVNQYRRILNG